MKTVFLTSNHKRHQYIAQCLYEQTDLQLIITEEKSPGINDTSKLSEEDKLFLETHFKAREQSEKDYFVEAEFPNSVLLLKLSHGEINSQLNLEVLQDIQPDLIVLFGTSIIKDPLLEAFPNKFVNLHLGLSPYFKGSATNLFPLLYKKPQCIGATIHVATKKVDAGAILHQLRPKITRSDSLHDVGNKVILKAGKELPEILKKYSSGQLKPIKQNKEGEICRIKDLTPEKLRQVYMNIKDGLLEDYVRDKTETDKRFPIVGS